MQDYRIWNAGTSAEMEHKPLDVNLPNKAHEYGVVAWWTSGNTGIAKAESSQNVIHFTAPPEFGGLEGRWTPEDLLITAVASCFTTTFHAIAVYPRFEYADLAVEGEGMSAKQIADIVLRRSCYGLV